MGAVSRVAENLAARARARNEHGPIFQDPDILAVIIPIMLRECRFQDTANLLSVSKQIKNVMPTQISLAGIRLISDIFDGDIMIGNDTLHDHRWLVSTMIQNPAVERALFDNEIHSDSVALLTKMVNGSDTQLSKFCKRRLLEIFTIPLSRPSMDGQEGNLETLTAQIALKKQVLAPLKEHFSHSQVVIDALCDILISLKRTNSYEVAFALELHAILFKLILLNRTQREQPQPEFMQQCERLSACTHQDILPIMVSAFLCAFARDERPHFLEFCEGLSNQAVEQTMDSMEVTITLFEKLRSYSVETNRADRRRLLDLCLQLCQNDPGNSLGILTGLKDSIFQHMHTGVSRVNSDGFVESCSQLNQQGCSFNSAIKSIVNVDTADIPNLLTHAESLLAKCTAKNIRPFIASGLIESFSKTPTSERETFVTSFIELLDNQELQLEAIVRSFSACNTTVERQDYLTTLLNNQFEAGDEFIDDTSTPFTP